MLLTFEKFKGPGSQQAVSSGLGASMRPKRQAIPQPVSIPPFDLAKSMFNVRFRHIFRWLRFIYGPARQYLFGAVSMPDPIASVMRLLNGI